MPHIIVGSRINIEAILLNYIIDIIDHQALTANISHRILLKKLIIFLNNYITK